MAYSEDGLFTPSEAEIGINTISFSTFWFLFSESTKLIQVHEISPPETDLFMKFALECNKFKYGSGSFSNYNWSNGETT